MRAAIATGGSIDEVEVSFRKEEYPFCAIFQAKPGHNAPTCGLSFCLGCPGLGAPVLHGIDAHACFEKRGDASFPETVFSIPIAANKTPIIVLELAAPVIEARSQMLELNRVDEYADSEVRAKSKLSACTPVAADLGQVGEMPQGIRPSACQEDTPPSSSFRGRYVTG